MKNFSDRIGSDQLHIQPFYQQYSDPSGGVLEKRQTFTEAADALSAQPVSATERYNAVVQWDIVPNYPVQKHANYPVQKHANYPVKKHANYRHHYHHHEDDNCDDGDDGDDDEKDEDDEDDDDEDEDYTYVDDHEEYEYDDEKPYFEGENMNGDWWKYDKQEGWKHGIKANRRVIYFSTVAGAQLTKTITELPSALPHCVAGLPDVPIPVAERLVTVLVTPEVETIILPAEVRTIAGKEHTIQGAEKILTRFSPTTIVGEDIYLPGTTNVVTALGKVSTFTMAPLTIRGKDIFGTVTKYGATQYDATQYGATQYGATEYGATQYGATEILEGLTVTADGVVTTLTPDAVTVTQEVIVSAPPIISTVQVDVTHYLLRQTIVATTVATATAVQTVAVTSVNNVLVTLYGNTVTSTENVVVTVRRPKTTTVTSSVVTETAVAFLDQDSQAAIPTSAT